MSEETYRNVIEPEALHALMLKLNGAPKDLCGEEPSDYCIGCKHETYCREMTVLKKVNGG